MATALRRISRPHRGRTRGGVASPARRMNLGGATGATEADRGSWMEFKDYYATLGWNRARARRRSRPPTAGWHASTTRTSARRPGPKTSSRRSTRPTRAARPGKACSLRPAARAGLSPGRGVQRAAELWRRRWFQLRGSVRGGGANGGFSDFFESLFARQRGGAGPGPGFSSQGHAPNRDTRAKLSVPLEAAYSGDSLRITVNGKQLDVRVPKGIRPGQVIRLAGRATMAATCCWKWSTPHTRSSRSMAATSSTPCRSRRGRPRWAPASACRPWAARWN